MKAENVSGAKAMSLIGPNWVVGKDCFCLPSVGLALGSACLGFGTALRPMSYGLKPSVTSPRRHQHCHEVTSYYGMPGTMPLTSAMWQVKWASVWWLHESSLSQAMALSCSVKSMCPCPARVWLGEKKFIGLTSHLVGSQLFELPDQQVQIFEWMCVWVYQCVFGYLCMFVPL